MVDKSVDYKKCRIYTYIPNFIEKEKCKELYNYLIDNIKWEMNWKNTFINKCYEKKNSKYIYHTIRGEINILDEIINKIEIDLKIHNIKINKNIIISLYENGYNFHNYNKHLYGLDVYYIGLGISRDILIKDMTLSKLGVKKTKKINIQEGDLIIFNKEFNDYYKESIPKRIKINDIFILINLFKD